MKYEIELPTGFAVAGPSATHIDGDEGEVSVPLRRVAPKPPATVTLKDVPRAVAEYLVDLIGHPLDTLALIARAALAAQAGDEDACTCDGCVHPGCGHPRLSHGVAEGKSGHEWKGTSNPRCPVHGGDR